MQAARNKAASKTEQTDDVFEPLLEEIVEGKVLLEFQKGDVLFTQGAEANAIYFIQTGKVQVTVMSPQGKEAALAMFGPHDFLGEGCLVGDSLRTTTATSLQPSAVIQITKPAMLKALHAQPAFSEQFVTSLLGRNANLEEDLCDQLFNHSERRLARVLLKLARAGQHDKLPTTKMPRLTHKMLAEIVGTTRSRVTFFMNKFKKLGLIDYTTEGDITVRVELLTDAVLHD